MRGEAPDAREGHDAALVGKRLFMFGGCGRSADNINEVYYNDLYILNTGDFSLSHYHLFILLIHFAICILQSLHVYETSLGHLG